jgi:phosphoserine phosphatase
MTFPRAHRRPAAPGAALFDIPPERVVGVKTKIENNIITDTQDGEITFREGKLKALLKETGGIKPFLCSGNSTGDLHLLEGATGIRLAVGAAGPKHELYKTENELREIASQRGWLTHQF